jgi:hypothetical protein
MLLYHADRAIAPPGPMTMPSPVFFGARITVSPRAF